MVKEFFRNCEKLKTLKIGGNLDEQTRFNPEAFMVADLDLNIELIIYQV